MHGRNRTMPLFYSKQNEKLPRTMPLPPSPRSLVLPLPLIITFLRVRAMTRDRVKLEYLKSLVIVSSLDGMNKGRAKKVSRRNLLLARARYTRCPSIVCEPSFTHKLFDQLEELTFERNKNQLQHYFPFILQIY